MAFCLPGLWLNNAHMWWLWSGLIVFDLMIYCKCLGYVWVDSMPTSKSPKTDWYLDLGPYFRVLEIEQTMWRIILFRSTYIATDFYMGNPDQGCPMSRPWSYEDHLLLIHVGYIQTVVVWDIWTINSSSQMRFSKIQLWKVPPQRWQLQNCLYKPACRPILLACQIRVMNTIWRCHLIILELKAIKNRFQHVPGSKLPLFRFIVRDGHQPSSRGLYTYYKDSIFMVGWPSPI